MIVFKRNFSICLNGIQVRNFEFQHLILKQLKLKIFLIDKKSWIRVDQRLKLFRFMPVNFLQVS